MNSIDLKNSAFTKLDENPLVFATMVSCMCMYLLCCIWARKKDKTDELLVCLYFAHFLWVGHYLFVWLLFSSCKAIFQFGVGQVKVTVRTFNWLEVKVTVRTFNWLEVKVTVRTFNWLRLSFILHCIGDDILTQPQNQYTRNDLHLGSQVKHSQLKHVLSASYGALYNIINLTL